MASWRSRAHVSWCEGWTSGSRSAASHATRARSRTTASRGPTEGRPEPLGHNPGSLGIELAKKANQDQAGDDANDQPPDRSNHGFHEIGVGLRPHTLSLIHISEPT